MVVYLLWIQILWIICKRRKPCGKVVFCDEFSSKNHFKTKLSYRNLRKETHKGKFECPPKRILAPFSSQFSGHRLPTGGMCAFAPPIE